MLNPLIMTCPLKGHVIHLILPVQRESENIPIDGLELKALTDYANRRVRAPSITIKENTPHGAGHYLILVARSGIDQGRGCLILLRIKPWYESLLGSLNLICLKA